jgi:transcription elongation factor Elf1
MISLVEISKNMEVKKAICPQCKKTIHSIGFKKGSTCNGITVVCKFCGRVFEVKAD